MLTRTKGLARNFGARTLRNEQVCLQVILMMYWHTGLVNVRILSVEDDDNLAYVIAATFHLEGFDVTRAKDGHEALRLALEDNPPDLMILDVMLPDFTGFGACHRLRA